MLGLWSELEQGRFRGCGDLRRRIAVLDAVVPVIPGQIEVPHNRSISRNGRVPRDVEAAHGQDPLAVIIDDFHASLSAPGTVTSILLFVSAPPAPSSPNFAWS